MRFKILQMLVLIFVKRTNILSRIASIHTIGWNIVCNDGTCSDNDIIANSCITKNDAACSDKDIVANLNNANFCMCAYLDSTCIMCKEPDPTGQSYIIPDGDQPRPISIDRISTVVLKVFSRLESMSNAVFHGFFLWILPADNSTQKSFYTHIASRFSQIYMPTFNMLRSQQVSEKLRFSNQIQHLCDNDKACFSEESSLEQPLTVFCR